MDLDMITSGRMFCFYSSFRQVLSEAQGVRTNKALPKIGVRVAVGGGKSGYPFVDGL